MYCRRQDCSGGRPCQNFDNQISPSQVIIRNAANRLTVPTAQINSGECRMVKILEAVESVEPAMMDSLHEEQRVGATAGVRDWASKPTAATAERVPGSGEPDSASAAAQAIAADRSAERYAGRDRERRWSKSPAW